MDFINALIVLLNYTVIPALTYGSQLALGAIFVALIYGILRFANFATGDMMSFGTMFAVLLTYYFQSKGISFGFLPTALLTIPFAVAMMIFYMLLIDKTVFSYYRIKKSPPVQLAMVSLGVMFVTQAIIRIIIGPSDRRFLDGEKFILKATEFKEMTGFNEGLTIKSTQAITIVITIIVIACVDLIVNPSFNPVISLNSVAFKINFSPSRNLLSKGPMIILIIAWVTNITPTLTIANCTGGLFLIL